KVLYNSASATGPADFDQVITEYDVLAEAAVLDDFAQLHVVHHFHTKALVRTDSLVDGPTNEVEGADTQVVFRLRVGTFPRTVTEDEKKLEKSDHHFFSDSLHDDVGQQHNVIRLFGFHIRHGAAKAVGAEHYVGVGEEKPVRISLLGGSPHGVGFAHPPRRKGGDVDDLKVPV